MRFLKKKKTDSSEDTPPEPKPEKPDWDGVGTGTMANLKRWWYTRTKGYVILRTYDVCWDASTEEAVRDAQVYDCTLTHRLIKKSKLPPEAVHCTGEAYTFSVDKAQIRYGMHDSDFRATDAWLYLKYNGFDDCLTKKWTDMDHINPTKLMLILGAIAVGLVVLVMVMKG